MKDPRLGSPNGVSVVNGISQSSTHELITNVSTVLREFWREYYVLFWARKHPRCLHLLLRPHQFRQKRLRAVIESFRSVSICPPTSRLILHTVQRQVNSIPYGNSVYMSRIEIRGFRLYRQSISHFLGAGLLRLPLEMELTPILDVVVLLLRPLLQ